MLLPLPPPLSLPLPRPSCDGIFGAAAGAARRTAGGATCPRRVLLSSPPPPPPSDGGESRTENEPLLFAPRPRGDEQLPLPLPFKLWRRTPLVVEEALPRGWPPPPLPTPMENELLRGRLVPVTPTSRRWGGAEASFSHSYSHFESPSKSRSRSRSLMNDLSDRRDVDR